MRRYLLIVIAIALGVAVSLISHRRTTSSRSGGPRAALSAPAPDFSLQDIEGNTLTLANYRGKVVLLDFWATWCTPCQAEIPHFVEFQEKYREQGFQAIGISMDDDAKPVRAFYQKLKMNYPVALGTSQVAESYGGVLGLPITFLIGRDGHIAAKYVGAVETPVVEQKILGLLQTK